MPRHGSALERLVSSGRAAPPRLDLSDLPPPHAARGPLTASEALRQRDDR